MRRVRLLIELVVALVLVVMAGPAFAIEVLTGQETRLTLEVGRSQLIRLDRPAANVLIADPNIAGVEFERVSATQRLVWVYGVAPGETNLLAVDTNDGLVANVRVSVRQNVGQVNQEIARVSPGGRVSAAPVGNSLLITGTVRSPAEVANATRVAGAFVAPENVINNTRVDGPTQINLRVRIAEVSRTASRALGINWDATASSGNFLFRLVTQLPVVGATSSLAGQFRDGTFDLSSLIDALQSENMATLLAEPNLTAVSGQTASFFSGRQIAVVSGIDPDTGVFSTTYENVGVDLAFTPTLLADGRISIVVHPRVRSVSGERQISSSLTLPDFVTREASTTVELGSGQSFAIAGLFRSEQTNDQSRVPLVGDIPVFGELFRSRSFQRDDSELVIVVTPYLVQPVSRPTDVMAPIDRLSAPTDQTLEDIAADRPAAPSPLSTPDAVRSLAGGRRDIAAGFILN